MKATKKDQGTIDIYEVRKLLTWIDITINFGSLGTHEGCMDALIEIMNTTRKFDGILDIHNNHHLSALKEEKNHGSA